MTRFVPQNGYGKREWRADRKRGRRDGRLRAPAYNDVLAMVADDGAITAPYPQYLQSVALDEMAAELAQYVRQNKPRFEELGALRRRYADAKLSLERATDGVVSAEVPLTPAELLPRSRIEAQPGQDTVLRSRREAARARRIAAARGGEAAVQNALDELGSRIAAGEQAARSDFALAQTRAKQAGARGAMRVATYWEHLVLAHAEGAYLAPLIRYTSQVLPSWVFEDPSGAPESLGRRYELLHVVERLRPAAPEPESAPEAGPEPEKHEQSA